MHVALLLRMENDVEENPGPTVYDIIYPNRIQFVQTIVKAI